MNHGSPNALPNITIISMNVDSPRTFKNRTIIIAMWAVVSLLVGLSFCIRLPSVPAYMEVSAPNVQFRLESDFPTGGPKAFSDWFLHGENFELDPKLLKFGLGRLPIGTTLSIGQSDRYFPPLHLALAAWGSGKARIIYDWLQITKDKDARWIFFGIPKFGEDSERTVQVRPFKVSNLAFRSVTGAALALQYQASEPPPLSAEETNVLRRESLVNSAIIKILGEVIELNSGDVLWLSEDVGEIRYMQIFDNEIQFIYDGRVRSMSARTSGQETNLIPTIFEWLMSFSIISKGISIVLVLGGILFVSIRWWPKARLIE